MIARPVETIRFESDDYDSAFVQVQKYIKEFQTKTVVLGLPKHMNGDVGIRGEISIMFKEKQMCIRDRTCGQEAVFYQGEECLGGGVIEDVFRQGESLTHRIEKKVQHG